MKEEETGMQESARTQVATETAATGDSNATAGWRGPGWKGWVLSILVAILLSVTATLLLGGSAAFRSDRATGPAAGRSGSGTGTGCCPHSTAGK